jgi:hypothetical protein
MTHGDKAKAKGKISQASAAKKSSKKAGGKAVKTSKSGKTAGTKGGVKTQKGSTKKQGRPEKAIPAAKKSSSPAKAKESGATKEAGNPKARAADAGNGSFTNPVVGAAFKRAVKKYSNAFRKLTD